MLTTRSPYCVESCNFLVNLSTSTPDPPSLSPNKPGKPRIHKRSNKLTWNKDEYQFYNDPGNSHMGVVFALFGSRAYSNGSAYQWMFLAHTTYLSVDLSLIQTKMSLDDQQSYVFKVAAFNEWGRKAYKISKIYTGKEVISDSFPWWPVDGSQPPAYCHRISGNRTLLNLHHYNDYEKLEFSWNNDCDNELASTNVVLTDSTHALDEEFCYEVYVLVAVGNQDCYMYEGLYYVRGNETEITLDYLLSTCQFSVAAYAGTLAKSEYPSGDLSKELTLWIPGTSPACGKTNVLSM
jgi:hypothetical protein